MIAGAIQPILNRHQLTLLLRQRGDSSLWSVILEAIALGLFIRVRKPETPKAKDFRNRRDLAMPQNTPNEPVNPYADSVREDRANTLPVPASDQGDATGGVIPYKNPKALIAYYLGILSGLPFIGLPFGIAAFVLGIMGLRDRKNNPAIKGSVHAGIGIGCGGFFALLWGGLLLLFLFALVGGAFRN